MTKKPVFILGCPRSGTTIFMDILSFHKDFAWPSQYINKIPNFPSLVIFSRVYNLPYFGKKLRERKNKKFLPYPVEAWNFFNFLDPNFYPLPRSSKEVQKDPPLPSKNIKIRYIRTINKISKYQGKMRFIAKYTNKPRIKYLNQIFPDSFFIHVQRDGRGVVNSLYNKMMKEGWIANEERKNWIEIFPKEWQDNISNSSDPTITFLCYYYKHIVTRINEQQAELPKERTMTIQYEDFISNPIPNFKEICDNLDIDFTEDFEEYILSRGLKSCNYKWKENLSQSQINEMNKILNPTSS